MVLHKLPREELLNPLNPLITCILHLPGGKQEVASQVPFLEVTCVL